MSTIPKADELHYDTPLSLTAVRDLHLDLTGPLEYKMETLSSVDVTVSDPTLVDVTSVQVNTLQLVNDDGSIAEVGKAVQWRASQLKPSNSHVFFFVQWTATGGTSDTHRIRQNLEKYITE